ncbi:hypothetical protein HS125_01945 [bacterium]|nr:hypothetical protein [bacterium]
MLAGRRPMLATLERCLDADDAAVFHPQAPRFPGPKWAMARLRIEAVMRAFGWPAPDSPSGEAQVDRADYVERLLAGLPEPPPDSSIFAFAMPRNGDVAIRLVIPESEVTFAKLVFVRSMFLSTAGGGETENTPLDEK